MNSHQKEDGITVFDLKSIQSDGQTPLEMNLLDIYFKLKQDESIEPINSLKWIQLFNLAKYFIDLHFMKYIIEKVGLIERWYLLNDMNQFKPIDYMILELYLLENIQTVKELPFEIIQSLLHEERIHHDTKLKIIEEWQQPFEGVNEFFTQPITSATVIPKHTFKNNRLATLMNITTCILDATLDDTTFTLVITNNTTTPIHVYLQTHFKLVSDGSIQKLQGHLLNINSESIELKLHSPFEKKEQFEFEFSGLATRTPIQN